jgi:hypothetical protein
MSEHPGVLDVTGVLAIWAGSVTTVVTEHAQFGAGVTAADVI